MLSAARDPSPRSAQALLAELREPIAAACSKGLSALEAEPDSFSGLGEQLAVPARALAESLANRTPSRTPEKQERAERLVQSLRRFADEISAFARLSIADRQRLLAAGLRLTAVLGMELGPSTAKPARPASPIVPTPASPASAPANVRAPKPAAAPVSEVSVASSPPTVPPSDDPLLQPLLGQPGVGPRTAEHLAARGLLRILDALYFLPRRWEDLRAMTPVGALAEGVPQTTRAIVERCRIIPARRRFLESALRGEDGVPLTVRWFYFHPGLMKRLQPGQRLVVTGTPVRFRNVLQIVHPELEFLDGPDAGEPLGRVRVRYPDVEGVPARTLERLCQTICQNFSDKLDDSLPTALRQRLALPALGDALRQLHLPNPEATPEELDRLNQGLSPPQRRLVFEELFFLQLGLLTRRRLARVETGTPCESKESTLDPLRAILPFTPTRAQERAIAEIARDLARPVPMQRLLHGDVGSGKTLVAYAACELVMASGRQAAMMAPTEILAEQHARTLGVWAKATGRRLALLTATTPKTPRKTTLAQLQAGRFDEVYRLAALSQDGLDRESILAMLQAGYLDMVVGTHALLADRVDFAALGLVVIDEQHRFGVSQRAALRRKGSLPHVLVMTATPIPRTLALTLYGDLDVTQLDELPQGRTPPVTKVLSGTAGLARALVAVRRAVESQRQVFWVCPLIEDSEKLEFQSVTTRHATLVKALPELRIGLVHGRLSTDERDDIMTRFRGAEIDLLVATTVIEVGVDVPNASLMVVEGAERFGLAQLHQLRGRIGRGAGKSACILLAETPAELPSTEPETPSPRKPRASKKAASPTEDAEPAVATAAADRQGASSRLDVLARSTDGFYIAEQDLRLRGPGEVLGTKQAGLPPLRYADLLRDLDLLQIARREAAALLSRDPTLSLPEHRLTRRILEERWAGTDVTLE